LDVTPCYLADKVPMFQRNLLPLLPR